MAWRTPMSGINMSPAPSDPTTVPKVFIENTVPIDFPRTTTDLVATRLASGRDIPKKIVGTIMMRNPTMN